MRSTIAEALRDMRRLHNVVAGRLRGEILYLAGYRTDDPLPAAPQPWADDLAALITAGRDGTVTADTPHYLVYSDNKVVCWLTVHAEVVAPYSPMLTANQIKHQGQAAAVLAHLDRTTLFDLADERDRREGRTNPDTEAADEGVARRGALRVAAVGDLTRAAWVHVDADPAVTRCRRTGCSAEPRTPPSTEQPSMSAKVTGELRAEAALVDRSDRLRKATLGDPQRRPGLPTSARCRS